MSMKKKLSVSPDFTEPSVLELIQLSGLVKLGTSECGSAGMQYHHEFCQSRSFHSTTAALLTCDIVSAELSRGALDLTNMIHDGPSCQVSCFPGLPVVERN